jgi:ribosomal protein S18 acetylase RimI-like enzyme
MRQINMDPHFTPDWFKLLERTALPPGAAVTYTPIGPPEQPNTCLLPMMRLAASPWRIEALSTFYSPIFGPISEAQLDIAALSAVFARIRQDRSWPTAQLDLSPLNPDGNFFIHAQQALEAGGWIVSTYFRFGNWYAPIGRPDFAFYWAERPSALRNTFNRAHRKLQRRMDFDLRILQKPGPALDQAIADYAHVYAKSWKRPEPYPEFIPALCRLAAARGWLRLGILALDQQPVASEIWLVEQGRAQIVKLAYDPAYRHLSVGTVLTAEMMRHVIEADQVEEIDYLIGDDAYKRNWTPQRRERHGIIAFNPLSVRGLALAARHLGGRLLKRNKTRVLNAGLASERTRVLSA